MSDPQTKAELLDALRATRAAWEDLIAQVGRTRMTERGVVEGWAVKDLAAHLTAWESRPVAWLQAAQSGDTPRPPEWSRDLSEEQVNAWIWNAAQARSVDEVLDESRRVFTQLVELIEQTPEQMLTDATRFAWLNGNSLLSSMGGNTYAHYREHGEHVRAWLERINSKSS